MFLWINSIFFSVSFCFQFLSMSGTYSFLFSFYIVPFPLLLLYKILQCFGKIFCWSSGCIFFKIFKRTPCTSKFIKNKKKINIIQNRRTINTKTQKLQKNIYFVSYRKKTHTINKHTINTIQKSNNKEQQQYHQQQYHQQQYQQQFSSSCSFFLTYFILPAAPILLVAAIPFLFLLEIAVLLPLPLVLVILVPSLVVFLNRLLLKRAEAAMRSMLTLRYIKAASLSSFCTAFKLRAVSISDVN